MTAELAIDAATRADPDALVDALVAMTEKERRAIHDRLDELTRIHDDTRDQWRLKPNFELTALVALWGTGTARDVRSDFRLWRFVPHDRLVEVVAARPPKTIAALVRTTLADEMNRAGWFVVRDLVRRGIVEHPANEQYYCGVVRVLPLHSGPPPAPREPEAIADSVMAKLRADELLPDELMHALTYEEAVNWIAGIYRVDPWLLAFERAIGEGLLDRNRMLDVCIDGQLRDLRQSSSAFFRKVFEGLNPTIDELTVRAARLVRIVGASRPSEQGAAAASLRGLVAAGAEFDESGIGEAVVGPLTGTHKGAAIEALRLIDATRLDVADKCRAALHGLGHPHADVQRAAISILEAAGDLVPVEVRADVMIWVDAVAPANRESLVALVGFDAADDAGPIEGAEPHSLPDLDRRIGTLRAHGVESTNVLELIDQARRGEVPGPLHFDPSAVAAPATPLAPVGSIDELVGVLVTILSGAGTPLDLERAIDGLARFSSRAATDQQLSPLRAVFTADYAWAGWNVPTTRGLVEVAARHWAGAHPPRSLPYLVSNQRVLRLLPQLSHDLTAPPPDAASHWWTAAFDGSSQTAGITGFVAARMWEAVTIATTGPRPTLALPSTVDGWLDPADLAARLDDLTERRTAPGRFEAVQALLRLRPASSAPAIVGKAARSVVGAGLLARCGAVANVDDEGIARAAREAPRPTALRLVDFPKEAHKPAITVLRYEVDRPIATLRRDDPIGQLAHELVPPEVRPVVGVRWTPAVSALFVEDRLLIDWTVIGLPRHRELVEARAASLLAEDLDANRSSDTLHALLTAAAGPDVPMWFSTHVLLAVGLCDRNVVTCSAAADLVHDAATDGRLDPELLGGLLAELGEGGMVKPARFAGALAGIAAASPLVAERVRQAIAVWLGAISDIPRDVHAVLETLEVACAASGMGIASPSARSNLTQAAVGGSKRAKSARRLLELDQRDDAPAATAALVGLLDRAERWMASGGNRS